MSQGRPNILIAHGLDDELLAQIEETAPNASLRLRKREEVTVEDMTWADIFFGWPPRKFLKEAPGLSWIHLPSAGADGYTDPGIYAHSDVILTNSTGVFGIPLAEHAFAMMLAFSRTINRYIRLQQERRWEKLPSSDELYGKTLGILGLGDIGTQLALRAKAFGMKVWGYKRRITDKPPCVDHLVTGPDGLRELLAASDYVVIALPLTRETNKLMGQRELGWMQPHAVLINVGRGPIVDEQALIDALKEGRLAGAGLDVFEEEPLPPTSPLWDMPNVIITPHSGGVTPEANRRSTDIFCFNLKLWLEGRKDEMRNVVDLEAGY
ncbi:MAG: D-2-hydroxyacid dehydrogenase [Firmicutes bacterium]|jgi:phosphoglycerate dehydrogenase-like enzyme|nr:D-2-hydroxyacid dehydrogenase [Bacillota bacterium]